MPAWCGWLSVPVCRSARSTAISASIARIGGRHWICSFLSTARCTRRSFRHPDAVDVSSLDNAAEEAIMKLNGATIPDDVAQRVVERRGREHCFADLNPAMTALVVIDLQHAFMNDAVGHAVCPAARDIVPAVNRLAAAVRRSGGGVFWVRMTHED